MEMTIDRKIEIFKRVIKYLEDNIFHVTGICGAIGELYNLDFLSRDECKFMLNYLKENRPNYNNDFSEFTQNDLWNEPIKDFNFINYWWIPVSNKKDIPQELPNEIRISYLNKLIGILSWQRYKDKLKY